MTQKDTLQKKLEFAEEIGLVFEENGHPPMSGRVLGWLHVCSPVHQTAAELAEVLQASKGSISGTTRYMVNMGIIKKFSIPGKRSAYFKLTKSGTTTMAQTKMKLMIRMKHLTELGLDALDEDSVEQRERLLKMNAFYKFMEREFPRLIEKFSDEYGVPLMSNGEEHE